MPDPKDARGKEDTLPTLTHENRRLTRAEVLALVEEKNEELRMLRDEEGAASLRLTLRQLLKKCQRWLLETEPRVTITVPATKDLFTINAREYLPGTYDVPASVAEVLSEMIDRAMRVENRLYRDNGRTVEASRQSRFDAIQAEE